MYVCVHCAYLVPVEVRRGHHITWNLSYGSVSCPVSAGNQSHDLFESHKCCQCSVLNFVSTLSSQVSTLGLAYCNCSLWEPVSEPVNVVTLSPHS